jgi:hypothetical protein
MWGAPKFRPARAAVCFSLSLVSLVVSFFHLPFASGDKKETLTTPGLMREFFGSPEEIREAVLAVVRDQIIHGTKVFDKESVLTGAEAVDISPLFDPWDGPGQVFFKVRNNSIAPRHFLASGDIGTIAVRYVLIPVDQGRTRVKVDALYIETAHRTVHPSDGTVEKSELQEIKDQLDSLQEAAAEAADQRRRLASAELVRQSFQRQHDDESKRLNNAEASEKDLAEQVQALHKELERRVKAPGADLKAAPFHSAATLRTLPASAEVVVLIVTPHWLGVETPEGQRGWLPNDFLEPIP